MALPAAHALPAALGAWAAVPADPTQDLEAVPGTADLGQRARRGPMPMGHPQHVAQHVNWPALAVVSMPLRNDVADVASAQPAGRATAPMGAGSSPHGRSSPSSVSISPPTSLVTHEAPVAEHPRQMAEYATDVYWNQRYSTAHSLEHFDWFFSYAALRSIILDVCTLRMLPCLHVGCGNSDVSRGLASDGFHVVNNDISPVVIDHMQRVSAAMPPPLAADEGAGLHATPIPGHPTAAPSGAWASGEDGAQQQMQLSDNGVSIGAAAQRITSSNACDLPVDGRARDSMTPLYGSEAWEVVDCRCMVQYASGSFGTVLDKGTLDAVLCSPTGRSDVSSYIREVSRVLAPDGVFLLVSLGRPSARVPTLCPSGVAWASIGILLLPKPATYVASEACITGRPHLVAGATANKDQPVSWLGPYSFEQLEADVMLGHLDLNDYFFAYVARKACSSEAG